jgi:hypothetical protein
MYMHARNYSSYMNIVYSSMQVRKLKNYLENLKNCVWVTINHYVNDEFNSHAHCRVSFDCRQS